MSSALRNLTLGWLLLGLPCDFGVFRCLMLSHTSHEKSPKCNVTRLKSHQQSKYEVTWWLLLWFTLWLWWFSGFNMTLSDTPYILYGAGLGENFSKYFPPYVCMYIWGSPTSHEKSPKYNVTRLKSHQLSKCEVTWWLLLWFTLATWWFSVTCLDKCSWTHKIISKPK